MSWFSSKKQEPEVLVAQPATKTSGMIWLETSSEEIYQETITNMYNEVKAMGGFPKEAHASNAKIYARIFLKKIQKLDRNRMSSEQKRDLAMIVFGSFPRAVARMETQLSSVDEMHSASEEFGYKLRDLMEKYLDVMPRKIPVPNQLVQSTDEGKDKPVTVESIGDEEADAKLASVQKLTMEAYSLATSVEDRFFAETAANSYIPDSVRMLKGLMNAPEDMQTEAKELFLKQLGIIETQLKGIMQRSATHSLSEMKAHTEFLESKKEHKSALETF
jgi:hypothetical protein